MGIFADRTGKTSEARAQKRYDELQPKRPKTKFWASAKLAGLFVGAMGIPILAGVGGNFLIEKWNEPGDPTEISTRYTETLHDAWERSHISKRFLAETKSGAAHIIDPAKSTSTKLFTTSEGTDFSQREALQMDDQKTFVKLWMGLQDLKTLSGSALPAWHSYLENGELKILDDADRVSAMDANIGIAYNLLEAANRIKYGKFTEEGSFTSDNLIKEAQQMMTAIYEKGVVKMGPYSFLAPSDVGAMEDGALVYNLSYYALYKIEAFASADQNPQHDWKKVVKDNFTLRQKILDSTTIKTGHKTESVPLVGIPDWISVTWSAKQGLDPYKGIQLYTPGDRSYKMGYDAYRTLLNVALDSALLKDPDLKLASKQMAQKLMATVLGKTPDETLANVYKSVVYREVTNPETQERTQTEDTCKEFTLGLYTALAFAASSNAEDPTFHYGTLADHLKTAYSNTDHAFSFDKTKDPILANTCSTVETGNQEANYYYQFIILQAMQTLESAHRDFYHPFYSPDQSKDVQNLSNSHPVYETALRHIRAERFAFPGKIIPGWDGQTRSELEMLGMLEELPNAERPLHYQPWLIRNGHISEAPNFAPEVLASKRLKAATRLDAMRLFDAAVREYLITFNNAPTPEQKLKTFMSLSSTLSHIEEFGKTAYDRVLFFQELLNADKGNELLNLGLAQAYAATYDKNYYNEAIRLADGITAPEIRAIAQSLSAATHLKKAQLAAATGDETEKTSQIELTLKAIGFAIAGNADQKDNASYIYQNAEALFSAYDMTKVPTYLTLARDNFASAAIAPQADEATKLNATLGLCRCYRTLGGPENLSLALKKVSDEKEARVSLADTKKMTPLEDPGYLQLQVEEIRVLTLQGNKAEVNTKVSEILASIPRGEIRGSFARIKYLLDNGDIAKAREDASQLKTLFGSVEYQSSLEKLRVSAPDMQQLKTLILQIRTKLLPALSKLPQDPEQKREAQMKLYSAFENDFLSKVPAGLAGRIAGLTDLINTHQYETIATKAERVIELSSMATALKEKGTTKQAEVLAYANQISSLLSPGSILPDQILKASKAAEDAIIYSEETLHESELSSKRAEAILEFYKELINISTDKQVALALTAELLGEKIIDTTSMDTKGTLYMTLMSLRDKDVRAAMDHLVAKPDQSSALFASMGEFYMNNNANSEAIGYYRKSFGLSAEPKPKDLEAERNEYLTVYQDQPEKRGNLSKMLKIVIGDPTRDAMFTQVLSEIK